MHDWLEWTNSAVGLAALLLTIGALWQAAGARKAAEQARQAVYRRNALEDVRRLERNALGLQAAIEAKQYGLAIHQAREFYAECAALIAHHRSRLGADGAKLKAANDQVSAISRQLQAGRDLGLLILTAQAVTQNVSTVAGALSRRQE